MNIECAVQRKLAQDVLLNRIGLGQGPFPLAMRGNGGSGVFEADRVIDLLRTERDDADSERRQNGGSRLIFDDLVLIAVICLLSYSTARFQLGQNRSQ